MKTVFNTYFLNPTGSSGINSLIFLFGKCNHFTAHVEESDTSVQSGCEDLDYWPMRPNTW
jgi:hypothetical protein